MTFSVYRLIIDFACPTVLACLLPAWCSLAVDRGTVDRVVLG